MVHRRNRHCRIAKWNFFRSSIERSKNALISTAIIWCYYPLHTHELSVFCCQKILQVNWKRKKSKHTQQERCSRRRCKRSTPVSKSSKKSCANIFCFCLHKENKENCITQRWCSRKDVRLVQVVLCCKETSIVCLVQVPNHQLYPCLPLWLRSSSGLLPHI